MGMTLAQHPPGDAMNGSGASGSPGRAGANRSKGRAPLFLVGMPGAGKTTIGKALARALSREFIDVDHEIERRAGVQIPTIFDLEGEPGFRRREAALIDELTQRSGVVLATGGGAVLDPVNRERLHERGLVIYLRAQPADLYARTRHDRSRPLLRTDDPLATLERLHAQRGPLYEEVAHVTVDTGEVPIPVLVNRVLPMVRMYLNHPELVCRK